MAGLRKILHVEKPFFLSGPSSENADQDSYAPSSCELSPMAPDPGLPRLSQMQNQTFQGIERQFEELHDQFRLRSSRSFSSKCYKHLETKPSPIPNKRHIDVLQAIFSSRKRRVATPATPSTGVYNEDIADRNLRVPMSVRVGSSPYSRVVAAMYQEDVADRNIRANGSNVGRAPFSRYKMRLKSTRRRDEDCMAPRSKSELATHSDSYVASSPSALRIISSDQDLRNIPPAVHEQQQEQQIQVDSRPAECHNSKFLRPQCSAPALSPKSTKYCASRLPPTPEPPGESTTSLGAPPATRDRTKTSSGKPNPLAGKPANRLLSPNQTRSVSRKNIHDLSINTSLAAPRKAFVKVEPRPVELQVPTPKQDPSTSIAEIVNSPISTAPSSRPSPSYNVDEMMNLFKQAYSSSQPTRPHPTFETLQDAIIREINSHDAFRHINSDSSTLVAPELSPDLTSDDCAESQATANGMGSFPSGKSITRQKFQLKHSEKKAPVRRPRRKSDLPGRELSFPALKGVEQSARGYLPIPRKKRRHTYAQPPSLDLVQSYENEPMPKEVDVESRGRRPRTRHDGTTSFPNPSDGQDISNPDHRPHSSHGSVSKAVSAVLDPSSESSKRSHSRNPLRSSSRPKSGATGATSSVREIGPPEQQPKQQPENHASPIVEKQVQQLKEPIPEMPSLEPKFTSIRPPVSHDGSKAVWSTSPIPGSGRKRIPLRRSSIQKDMYDSSRFRI